MMGASGQTPGTRNGYALRKHQFDMLRSYSHDSLRAHCGIFFAKS